MKLILHDHSCCIIVTCVLHIDQVSHKGWLEMITISQTNSLLFCHYFKRLLNLTSCMRHVKSYWHAVTNEYLKRDYYGVFRLAIIFYRRGLTVCLLWPIVNFYGPTIACTQKIGSLLLSPLKVLTPNCQWNKTLFLIMNIRQIYTQSCSSSQLPEYMSMNI